MAKAKKFYYGTGRRKESVARVRLHAGTGNVEVNGRPFENYFPIRIQRMQIAAPLEHVNMRDKYDVFASIKGGGISGQAGALRHGIARAMVEADESLRLPLKKAGYLTRDSRMKERKKYGLKSARKKPQFSKR